MRNKYNNVNNVNMLGDDSMINRRDIGKFALSLILFAMLFHTYSNFRASPATTIHGYVFDNEGKPLSNAIIIVFDVTDIRLAAIVNTDINGYYSISLEKYRALYKIYVIHHNGSKMDYIPAKLDLLEIGMGLTEVYANFTLYPAAYIHILGDIKYVGGYWRGSFETYILDSNGISWSSILDAGSARVVRETGDVISIKPKLISNYSGVTGYYIIVLKRAEEAGKIPADLLTEREALAPLNRDFIVKIVARVIDERGGRRKAIDLPIVRGSPDNPLRLVSPSQVLTIDLTQESVKRAIDLVRSDVRNVRDKLEALETTGFYMVSEEKRLNKAEQLVDEAQLIPPTSPQNIEDIMDKLERAYVIATVEVVNNMNFLVSVAREGASLLPIFLATFSVSLAFYFFEQSRRKLITYLILYGIFIGMFSQIYPGFSLINRTLLLISTVGSLVIIALLIFIIPAHIKEPEVTGKIQRRSLIAITFSMAKRYSRVRKTRTFITVFSLSALIWAFTVLASISTVYGLRVDAATNVRNVDGLLVKRVINNTVYPLNFYSDYRLLQRTPNVSEIFPVVMTNPKDQGSIIIRKNNRIDTLKTAIGLTSKIDYFTDISRTIKGDIKDIDEERSIIIPRSLADKLNVKIGDNVTVIFRIPGKVGIPYNLRVIGILYEDAFDKIVELDSRPLKPYVIIDGKMMYANSSDVVIVNWNFLYNDVKAGYIYSIYMKLSLMDKAEAIARNYIERKGSGYYVWICRDGSTKVVYFGETVENIFEKNIAFIVPIIIVSINVIISMYSIVHERHREIFIFNAIGFNPTQIATIFLAESIIYGLLGGGIGYLAGLATFRIMAYLYSHPTSLSFILGVQPLIVRAKLEWYWSIIMILLSILVSMIASFKPALDAAFLYSPTKVKKLKIEEKERERREEVYLKTYAEKTIGLPIKVEESIAPIFFSFIYTRLKDLMLGYIEKVEDLEELEEEEYPDGRRVKRFVFKYVFKVDDKRIVTNNELIISKMPKNNYYTADLVVKPSIGKELPVKYIDRTASILKDIVKDWEREKTYIV